MNHSFELREEPFMGLPKQNKQWLQNKKDKRKKKSKKVLLFREMRYESDTEDPESASKKSGGFDSKKSEQLDKMIQTINKKRFQNQEIPDLQENSHELFMMYNILSYDISALPNFLKIIYALCLQKSFEYYGIHLSQPFEKEKEKINEVEIKEKPSHTLNKRRKVTKKKKKVEKPKGTLSLKQNTMVNIMSAHAHILKQYNAYHKKLNTKKLPIMQFINRFYMNLYQNQYINGIIQTKQPLLKYLKDNKILMSLNHTFGENKKIHIKEKKNNHKDNNDRSFCILDKTTGQIDEEVTEPKGIDGGKLMIHQVNNEKELFNEGKPMSNETNGKCKSLKPNNYFFNINETPKDSHIWSDEESNQEPDNSRRDLRKLFQEETNSRSPFTSNMYFPQLSDQIMNFCEIKGVITKQKPEQNQYNIQKVKITKEYPMKGDSSCGYSNKKNTPKTESSCIELYESISKWGMNDREGRMKKKKKKKPFPFENYTQQISTC